MLDSDRNALLSAVSKRTIGKNGCAIRSDGYELPAFIALQEEYRDLTVRSINGRLMTLCPDC